jgi:predicted thioesterase
MRQVIAEQLEEGTGSTIGARTVRGTAAACLLVGNELAIGIVELRTTGGRVSIRVSADERDYQRARVYENGKLIESLHYRDGSVVYVNEAASLHIPDAAGPAGH